KHEGEREERDESTRIVNSEEEPAQRIPEDERERETEPSCEKAACHDRRPRREGHSAGQDEDVVQMREGFEGTVATHQRQCLDEYRVSDIFVTSLTARILYIEEAEVDRTRP